jgi:hypothetical protein
VGRLDDILARNRAHSALSERNLTSLLVSAFLLVIIALAAFTKLGQPADAPAIAPPAPTEHRVDGVMLGQPRAGTGISPRPAAAK